jgi:hypothetical protein
MDKEKKRDALMEYMKAQQSRQHHQQQAFPIDMSSNGFNPNYHVSEFIAFTNNIN